MAELQTTNVSPAALVGAPGETLPLTFDLIKTSNSAAGIEFGAATVTWALPGGDPQFGDSFTVPVLVVAPLLIQSPAVSITGPSTLALDEVGHYSVAHDPDGTLNLEVDDQIRCQLEVDGSGFTVTALAWTGDCTVTVTSSREGYEDSVDQITITLTETTLSIGVEVVAPDFVRAGEAFDPLPDVEVEGTAPGSERVTDSAPISTTIAAPELTLTSDLAGRSLVRTDVPTTFELTIENSGNIPFASLQVPADAEDGPLTFTLAVSLVDAAEELSFDIDGAVDVLAAEPDGPGGPDGGDNGGPGGGDKGDVNGGPGGSEGGLGGDGGPGGSESGRGGDDADTAADARNDGRNLLRTGAHGLHMLLLAAFTLLLTGSLLRQTGRRRNPSQPA